MEPTNRPKQGFTRFDIEDATSWAGVEKLSVFSGIRSLEDYYRAVGNGMVEAQNYASSVDLLVGVPISKVRIIHEIVFGEVHPWAGDLRGPANRVKIGGVYGADGARVEQELALASAQMKWVLGRVPIDGPELDSIRHAGLALYHARFERIHPFRDGNGRVGRIILYAQLKQLTGEEFKFKESQKPEYIKAIRAADAGDLAPLANILRPNKAPITEAIPSPFRMEPLSATDPRGSVSSDEQFRESFVQ